MKIRTTYLLLVSLSTLLCAQNIDSLYNRFLDFKQHDEKIHVAKPEGTNYHEEKCGFGILATVAENFNSFNKEQQNTITSLITRPVLDTSIVTPKGYFRLHFDTSNSLNNKPGYDIDSLADVLDHVYEYETEVLGYPPAPGDNGEGGDELYDFYVQNQSPGYYGYTQPESMINNSRWRCYSVIDNDFKGYESAGLEGAMVTVAHEYHHAIQIGRYINKYSTEGYYYEISSVAMEEFVYDDINDYYHYMKSYFRYPDKMLSSNSGYNTGHWNMFLEQRFGQDILIRIWELMAEGNESLVAMSKAIAEEGSSFKTEFNTFGVWNYFTGPNAQPDKYFEEGQYYPAIVPQNTLEYDETKRTLNFMSAPVSNYYIRFDNTVNDDTLMAIITNSDYFHGCCQNNYRSDVSYSLQSFSAPGTNAINDGYYSIIESEDIDILAERTILNYDASVLPKVYVENRIPFPQPFRYGVNYVGENSIKIPALESSTGMCELSIFSVSMTRVFQNSVKVENLEEQGMNKLYVRDNYVRWNGFDDNGDKLPSGVYIYVVKADDDTHKGKLVIYHD